MSLCGWATRETDERKAIRDEAALVTASAILTDERG